MGKQQAWRYDPQFKPFYKRKAWRDVRSFVWDRAHGLCERCLEKGKTVPAEVVHHKVPLNAENVNDPDIALNPDRLIALCHDCHTLAHQDLGVGALNGHRHEMDDRVGFDSEGNVVKLEQSETLQDFLDEWRHLDEYLDGTMEMPQAFAEGLAAHGYRVNEEGNVVRP